MKHVLTLLLTLFYATSLLSCQSDVHDTLTTSRFTRQDVRAACLHSPNRGKHIQIFGGSLSVRAMATRYADILKHTLHTTIQFCGRDGAGYGLNTIDGTVNFDAKNGSHAFTANNCVPEQVDHYADPKADIYILWCSTNDYTGSNPIGTVESYSAADGYATDALASQCGGLNYCIQSLRTLNPQAKIYIFDALKFFATPGGYDKESAAVNSLGAKFYDYVLAQDAIGAYHDIAVLRQFDLAAFTKDNATQYYLDGYHLNAKGYETLAWYHLYFLATEKTYTGLIAK